MARIIFLCDPAITGSVSLVSLLVPNTLLYLICAALLQGHIDFLEENNQDDLCYYMFSLAAKAVCGYPADLSIGDIILIM